MSWSFGAGDRPFTVTVYEDRSSPFIQSYCRDRSRDKIDPATGKIIPGYAYKSLGDAFKKGDSEIRDRAKQWAKDESARLHLGIAQKRDQVPTLSLVLGLYLQHRTPAKVESEQDADRRRGKMWCRRLGANKDLRELAEPEWTAFINARRSGESDAEGNLVPVDERKPVRDGTIWADCVFLRTIINFACQWQRDDRKFLMDVNPASRFKVPTEKNPRQPYATQDRVEAILKVAAHVHPYLAPMLTIVNGTGRRIMAVIELRFQDVRLARTKHAQHGAIQWPGETDKMGKMWSAPIKSAVRAALDRIISERPGVGNLPLFPSPDDPTTPISRYKMDRALTTAERLANVPKHQGSLWHAYRRKWATERKPFSDVDVAAAGGWSDLSSLKRYQQVDPESVYRVVVDAPELRESLDNG